MKLIQIDKDDIQSDQARTRPNVGKCNTAFHTADEAPGHGIPSERPYSFRRWLPLILNSCRVPAGHLQNVVLTPTQGQFLLEVARGSIQRRCINRMYREEVMEILGPAFNSLVFPPEGLYMRLDACSAKDGAWSEDLKPNDGRLHKMEDVLLRLVTSTRAYNAVRNALDSGAPIELFFLPFDKRMRSAKEYRAFCPPGGEIISGISQYEWHQRWKHHDLADEDKLRYMERIAKGCETIRKQILQELDIGSEMDQLFLKQGFTFDVLYHMGTCELIELNVFGPRSACGSCLFHWVEDEKKLYGTKPREAEFRVVRDGIQTASWWPQERPPVSTPLEEVDIMRADASSLPWTL